MLRYITLIALLHISLNVHAEDWQLLGDSNAGKHWVDYGSIVWNADEVSFTAQTKVEQLDGETWNTTMNIACKTNLFFYVRGEKIKDHQVIDKTKDHQVIDKIIDHQVIASFSKPTKAEKIMADSMPDNLKNTFCQQSKKVVQWQKLGESNVSTVYFDEASVKKNAETHTFSVNTKVEPFTQTETTFSSLFFNCSDKTFSLLKMVKLKEGKTSLIFDKLEPNAPVSKTATLEKLANKFCQ